MRAAGPLSPSAAYSERGLSHESLPASTRSITAQANTTFDNDAAGKIVSLVMGCLVVAKATPTNSPIVFPCTLPTTAMPGTRVTSIRSAVVSSAREELGEANERAGEAAATPTQADAARKRLL